MARQTLGLTQSDVFNIDGYFGMNTLASGLWNIYNAGSLAVIHDASLRYPISTSLDPSRSHFEMMDVLEYSAFSGDILTANQGGWIARHLNGTAPVAPVNPLRATAFSVAVPKSHASNPGTLPVPQPASFGLAGDPNSKSDRETVLQTMFASSGVDPLVAQQCCDDLRGNLPSRSSRLHRLHTGGGNLSDIDLWKEAQRFGRPVEDKGRDRVDSYRLRRLG